MHTDYRTFYTFLKHNLIFLIISKYGGRTNSSGVPCQHPSLLPSESPVGREWFIASLRILAGPCVCDHVNLAAYWKVKQCGNIGFQVIVKDRNGLKVEDMVARKLPLWYTTQDNYWNLAKLAFRHGHGWGVCFNLAAWSVKLACIILMLVGWSWQNQIKVSAFACFYSCRPSSLLE